MVEINHMPWPAHATVAEVVFDKLPADVQKNLDKQKMKDSSNDPDEIFKDTALHHYPPSYKKATEWLDNGKKSYDNKDYEEASHCFGIASHYISDTFMAPHCVSREKAQDHHNFEKATNDMTPKASYLEGDLDSLMKKGVEQGKIDWPNWLKTHDTNIVQREVNEAASASFTAIKNTLS